MIEYSSFYDDRVHNYQYEGGLQQGIQELVDYETMDYW